ncbi:methyltransferase [Alloalcanivorax venustensis]|jgi:3' terminal RNA ribose 2'-O-methyltransferase Hen1|uniref:methyltransferase n=1 Tax=Alloalcanivorax TaxID=3020832 RepID=UPI002EAE3F88|nr:methyltransferase [Pseudomonadota bacterium]|tara:strand:- start:546 stop:1205 length:660 start_codon:yes stop_codon:yes gene_type:complete
MPFSTSMMDQATPLHAARLNYVLRHLKASGARRVLDLGCGGGWLLHELLGDDQFTEVVGLESSAAALAEARAMLAADLDAPVPRLRLLNASYLDHHPALAGFDAAAMVETIEHIPPGQLSRVEQAVFGTLAPATLIVTTPNVEYNPLYGLAPGQFREADHKFEWSRDKFRQWARGVAGRNGYRVAFGGIGDADMELGPPSQVAFFRLTAAIRQGRFYDQ